MSAVNCGDSLGSQQVPMCQKQERERRRQSDSIDGSGTEEVGVSKGRGKSPDLTKPGQKV